MAGVRANADRRTGSGLGAAISALEGTSGRQCVWATAQYLSYAKPGEVVDVDVTIAVAIAIILRVIRKTRKLLRKELLARIRAILAEPTPFRREILIRFLSRFRTGNAQRHTAYSDFDVSRILPWTTQKRYRANVEAGKAWRGCDCGYWSDRCRVSDDRNETQRQQRNWKQCPQTIT